MEWNYLHEGCRHALIDPGLPQGSVGMLLLKSPSQDGWQGRVGEGTMLVVLQLQRNRVLWQRVLADERMRVSFDLYDVGIAFYDPKLQRQDYVINW